MILSAMMVVIVEANSVACFLQAVLMSVCMGHLAAVFLRRWINSSQFSHVQLLEWIQLPMIM
ncbi:hypothetical protein D3C84_1216160 [compost metagenome]